MKTSALTKPKLKSQVAETLTKGKLKPARKRKAARSIPVAQAENKKVTGRKRQKSAKSKLKTRVSIPGKQRQIKRGKDAKKSVKAVKSSKKVKITHTAIKPLKRTAVANKTALAHKPKILQSQPKQQLHITPAKKKPETKPMPATSTILEKPILEVNTIQVSPNLSDKALHDYKLVRRAIDRGDQKAFAELMSRYKDSIYFMLLKMVNNRDDAEDLTIEAFGKAFKNIRQYTPDYAFSTWLFKIATNNCIDFIRKKRKQAFSLDRGFENDEGQEMALEVKSLHPDPEEHYIKKQKVEMMRDVVDKLKPRYKKLVELRYFQELAYEEIAVELNLPLGTVKAQLFRAREFLYQIMKNSAHHI